MYRATSVQGRRVRGGGRGGTIGAIALLFLAGAAFVLVVRWFRADESVTTASDAAVQTDGDDTAAEDTTSVARGATLTLSAVEGETGSATVVRDDTAGVYSLTIVGDLPGVGLTTTAYEAWFVKPGITDFFSLGEMYPREDGKWGLVWSQTDALVRHDIDEFQRIIIIREPRDGNTAPSADHVLSGSFE